MINNLSRNEIKLEWITPAPLIPKKVVMLIPQFNELSQFNILKRLRYFQELADTLTQDIDIVIIDDGSTDGSLAQIKKFVQNEECNFYVVAVYPNTNKVGALYLTALQVHHSLIILSDFDTDFYGHENLSLELDVIYQNEKYMGGYFRMLPFEGMGKTFLFQQIEYSLARSMYKFHQSDQSVPVMPGAGSCYRRDILISIFEQHSGLRSGEDRESTLIGLKLGYETKYIKNVLTLTRPPLTLRKLIKQRVRWNLGYIETFAKEKKYYLQQVKKLTNIGKRSLYDLMVVIFVMFLPIIALTITISNPVFIIAFGGLLYLSYIIWCVGLIMLAPSESKEFLKSRALSVLIYPVYKIILDYTSWSGALWQFYKKNKSKNGYYNSFVLKELKADIYMPPRTIREPLLFTKIG
ncbi:Glycosyltransferase, catalytic subunit of cellulose synthase and poly-beta-1,6-N-acetylglucosamine synthase [Pedobacter terrae]|uniref:Glycosyltransferase, catalytic subunit of cellulose synthase and poly-beta-1,6-N-acetylglucosamine synthase n=1 Tax=Pedobacter terrae TaxID=405671 RepID=A0A1G8EEW7_9SPHI|nr:glycosyltransferase family 2 protein [Pedobacter terrae]SDH68330.1 Glycosyltransferase, catalytic subunit of cellulose synthase and poly-beta-1,6-N-acetylglucosamine synthase [Pedobacter terrae]